MVNFGEGNSMKKALKSVGVVTFAIILSLALGTGAPAKPYQKGPEKEPPKTILKTLLLIKGGEAFVSAIKVVDKYEVGAIQLGKLLNDRKAKHVILAPSNEGFEKFLRLNPRALEGLDVKTIEGVLPALLKKVDLDEEDLYNVLLKHISVAEKRQPHSMQEEVKKVYNTVLDESDLPVAIGGKGVYINFESSITERDVYTVNGIIHYLDNVIVDAEEEEPTPPPEDDEVVEWCDRKACEQNESLYDECVEFMGICLLEAGDSPIDREKCAVAGLLICGGEDV